MEIMNTGPRSRSCPKYFCLIDRDRYVSSRTSFSVHRTEKHTFIRTLPISTHLKINKSINQETHRITKNILLFLSSLNSFPLFVFWFWNESRWGLTNAQSSRHTPPSIPEPGKAQSIFLKKCLQMLFFSPVAQEGDQSVSSDKPNLKFINEKLLITIFFL